MQYGKNPEVSILVFVLVLTVRLFNIILTQKYNNSKQKT